MVLLMVEGNKKTEIKDLSDKDLSRAAYHLTIASVPDQKLIKEHYVGRMEIFQEYKDRFENKKDEHRSDIDRNAIVSKCKSELLKKSPSKSRLSDGEVTNVTKSATPTRAAHNQGRFSRA